MKTKTVMVCIYSGMLLLHSCSNQPVVVDGGGGTETVIGMVYHPDGTAAEGVHITLVPDTCNIVAHGPLPDSFQTITGESGSYIFDNIPTGSYNIIGMKTSLQQHVYRTAVAIQPENSYSFSDTLQPAGSIQIVFSDTVDTNTGYIFIRGTLYYQSLSVGNSVPGGLFNVTLADIPAVTLTNLEYGNDRQETAPVLLQKQFTVQPFDTLRIDAYKHYVVIGSAVYTNGIYASGTQVTIVPHGYIPQINDPLPLPMTDTTGVDGTFVVQVSSPGTYAIQAIQPDRGEYFYHANIPVDADTIILAPDKLSLPSSLKLVLPDTINTTTGKIVIEGTTIVKSLAASTWLDTGFQVCIIDSLPTATFSAMYYLDENLKYERAVDTVTLYSGETLQREAFVNWYHYTTANCGLPSDNVLDLVIAPDNTTWFGTTAGAAHYDGTVWETHTKETGALPSDTVTSMAIDSSGIVWAGTANGIARFTENTWETFSTTNSPLPDDEVFEVVTDKTGAVWVGTNNGAARFDGDTSWEVYTTDNSLLPHLQVYCIAIDHDDVVWLGTDGGGLAKKDDTTWTIYTELNSTLPSREIFALYVDENNTKLVGANAGVAFYDNVSWSFDRTGPLGNYEYFVSAIAIDQDKTPWFGSYEGGRIFRFDGNRNSTYNSKTSILDPNAYEMMAIAVDSDNYKWVSTSRSGVYVFGPIHD